MSKWFLLFMLYIVNSFAMEQEKNPWISKKLLHIFLPKPEYKKLNKTIDITTGVICYKHAKTEETIFKKPKYQLVLDLWKKLPKEVVHYIHHLCKDEKQYEKDLHAIRQGYVNSYGLYKRMPKDTWNQVNYNDSYCKVQLNGRNAIIHVINRSYKKLPYQPHNKTLIVEFDITTSRYLIPRIINDECNVPCINTNTTYFYNYICKEDTWFGVTNEREVTYVNLATNERLHFNKTKLSFTPATLCLDTKRKLLLCSNDISVTVVFDYQEIENKGLRFRNICKNFAYSYLYLKNYDERSGLCYDPKEKIVFEDIFTGHSYTKKKWKHRPLVSSCFDSQVGVFGIDDKGDAKIFKPCLNYERMEQFLENASLYDYVLMHDLLKK